MKGPLFTSEVPIVLTLFLLVHFKFHLMLCSSTWLALVNGKRKHSAKQFQVAFSKKETCQVQTAKVNPRGNPI